MGGEDGVPGDGVSGGHSIEQLASGIEMAGAAKGSDAMVVVEHLRRGERASDGLEGSE